jgi:multidrug transporter EmrE-like cation transporter
MSSTTIAPILPVGVGYGVVVGIGFFFALVMAFVSYIQVKEPDDQVGGSWLTDSLE